MNLSGRAVAKVAAFYKMAPQEILAIYDDVSLPLGRIRLRAAGSAGGHNGIKSMIAELASSEFPRLKVGIDGHRPEDDLADFVLGKFSRAEAETLEAALQCVLDSGLATAMNRFNRDTEALEKRSSGKAKAKSKEQPTKPFSNQPDQEPKQDHE
jgi:PTH1 family peptidyl-tRNA hydrolase